MRIKLLYGPADGLELNMKRAPQLLILRIYNGQIVFDDDSLECPLAKYYYRKNNGSYYHLDEVVYNVPS